ncbi:MAG: 4-alpha-glucanotransferase [Thiobacillaceae bacterium]
MNELIDRLAELAGIQPLYQDIWGHTHHASVETKQALLAAMGIACSDEAAARESLRQWEQAAWQRLLPAVSVHSVGESPLRVTLRLPARDLGRTARWRLILEQGGVHEGEFRPDSLAQLKRAELPDGEYLALSLDLPPSCCDTPGYHRLKLALDGLAGAEMSLIVCPATCYQPPAVSGERKAWGVAVQLYGVRSARNWGMGDFTDLANLVDWAAGAGAALVGVNPLHALYLHNPRHCSPYSPSSRQFLNLLYIDVEAVPEYAECAAARAAVADTDFEARLAALRAAPLVDYAGVAQVKLDILRRLYEHFRTHHLAVGSDRARAFRAYCEEQGEHLYLQALYEALQAHFYAQDVAFWGWPVWPESYRNPHSPAVRQWADAHRDEIEYHRYLHWQAATQLDAAAERARRSGLGVGLYQDLAVGVDRGGAETWIHGALYAFEASVGAPPDDFNLHGQNWGLPPLIPHRLREAAYLPFIRMLRANMRTAGALRIDHIMGLMRLYWVPPGRPADQGVYVTYPLRDLMGILALESQRNRCLVIGEDLGTVPDAVRAAMREMGILAYRLFYFEKHWQGDHSFKAPWEIERDALVAASTHDLPTLAGFWRGSDIALRSALGLFPSDGLREAQIVGRAEDRARLLLALEREGLLPAGMTTDPAGVPEMTPALALAIQRYLARSPARLLLVQAEDMLNEAEQANLPGTVSGHPNWQRKLSLDLEEWAADARMTQTARALSAERR